MTNWNSDDDEPLASADIVIIGAGFSGIGMAVELKRRHIDSFVILEKATELGGVWRDNTYPGAACDAPSHLYSYSFEPHYDWSRKFAPQGEILAYLKHCATKYDIDRHVRLGSEVSSAIFDEAASKWIVRTPDRTYCAKILLSAVGQLHTPSIPGLPGLAKFSGTQFHSARWKHDHDLTNCSVAIIGTGSTAVQIVPEIASKVRKLVIFQRTPGYIRPKPDHRYSNEDLLWFRRFPMLRILDRALNYVRNEARFINFDNAWLNRRAQRKLRAFLESRVTDVELRRQLTPEYALGCKRGLPSNEWFAALQRDNVELVTTPIERIEPKGVRTCDGLEHSVDTIILATGFKSTKFLTPIGVRGRYGRDLHQDWADGAEAYLGMTVSGFPNLFLLYGPNTNLAHSSVIYMLESQFRYIANCIEAMVGLGIRTMEVRESAQRRFNAALEDRLRRSVMVTGGCTSWFKTESGRVTNNWPTFSFLYRWRARRPKLRDYYLHFAGSDSERERKPDMREQQKAGEIVHEQARDIDFRGGVRNVRSSGNYTGSPVADALPD